VKVSELVANTKPVFSVMAGASFAKQVVNAGGYRSPFNYNIAKVEKDSYEPGFFGGVRVDGTYQNKHAYSVSASLGKLATGASYTSNQQFAMDSTQKFSSFKADGSLIVLNIAAHYKKLIPYGDLTKFKFYVVAGPSFDARLSKASLENQVTNAYKQIFIKGDLGLEFNNRSLYTLFLHYNHNIGSLTKSPIKTNMNSFQLGIMVKATDLL
jgi:hypothetical protein